MGDDWIKPENIVVNGPYKLTEWRTRDFIRSVVNTQFDGAEDLCFKEVVYFPYEDLDAIERYIETGRLDMNNAFEGQRTQELREISWLGSCRTCADYDLLRFQHRASEVRGCAGSQRTRDGT